MKRLLLCGLYSFTTVATAAPFLVSDPLATGVTQCGIYLDAAAKVTSPVGTDASGLPICKYDLASVSVGSHTVKATAISIDPVWGNQESAQSLPFAFSRPAASVTAPTNIKLVPQ